MTDNPAATEAKGRRLARASHARDMDPAERTRALAAPLRAAD